MIRDAAHGDGLTLFLVAGGKSNFQFARGGDGVLEEKLVEIAQAEHQQRVGDLLLERVVLAHEWRGCSGNISERLFSRRQSGNSGGPWGTFIVYGGPPQRIIIITMFIDSQVLGFFESVLFSCMK
jgi:hypothetical protein